MKTQRERFAQTHIESLKNLSFRFVYFEKSFFDTCEKEKENQMGADWYTFTSFSALGFIVSAEEWAALKSPPCAPYDYVFFSSNFHATTLLQVFIYDTRTVTKSEISVVGPYDIEKSFHSTTVAKNDLAAAFLQSPTREMNAAFGTASVCFQTVCSTQSIKKFVSASDYCDYHGFECENNEENEEENADE